MSDAIEGSDYGILWVSAHEKLQTLDLPGTPYDIPKERRVRRKLPWDKDLQPPYATLSLATEVLTDGPIGYQDVQYRFMLALVRASNRDPIEGAGDFLRWRQEVRRAFHHQKDWIQTPMRSCTYDVTVEPGEVLIPAVFLEMYDANYLMLNCFVREPRP